MPSHPCKTLSSWQGLFAKAVVVGTKKTIMINAMSCFMPINSNASERKNDGVHTRTGDFTIHRER